MLAIWGVSIVRGLDVPLPRLDALELDWRVFAFLTTVAVLASLIGSLLPSLRATRVESSDALRSRRHGSDVDDRRLRSGLVIAEVALATVLTVGTGLLLHSFEALQEVDSGFATSGVLLARVDLPPERYPMEQRQTGRFFERLVERLESVPGVDSAASTMSSPFVGPGTQNEVAVETETDADAFMPVRWRAVSPALFRTLGIPLHRGRSFDPMAQRVETVLSASVAARLWPGQDPIGQRIRWIHPSGPLFEVVGIVGEVQDLHIGEEPPPTVYVPQRVFNWSPMTVAVRSSMPLDTLIGPVKAAVAELDPLLAAPEMSTLAGQRSEALAGPLLGVRLLGVASMIAVLLASIGIYGVVAYAVSQRRREMGVRFAMGARPDQLVRLMLKDGVLLVGLGVAGGMLISLGLVESMRAILYSTSPFDPAILGSAAFVLVVIGLLASSVPALLAARVDPIKVLRQE
ncbi:MAG: ABC transporter permease [Acidobacteriota bacterium]